MGLWNAIKERDLGYLWISDSEVERGRELDSKLLDSVQADYARGAISAEVAAISTQQITDASTRNQIAQSNPWDGFKEGWGDGYKNVKGAIQKVTSGLFGGVLGLIPWQVWAGAIIFAVIYFWPVIRPFVSRFTKK